MRKPISYAEWRSSVVFVSDVRPFEKQFDGLDGYDFWRCDTPVPAAMFFSQTPIGDVEPLSGQHMEGPDYHQIGLIQQLKDGRWYVILGNQDPTFSSFESAAQYLWDNHWKGEVGEQEQLFKLMSFDRAGTILRERRCNWVMAVDCIIRDFGESESEAERCIADLGQIASRFHEWSGGHYVLIPIEED